MELEEESETRQWDELIPDALGLIFKKLPLEDILTVIPRVCKAWGKAVQGPYCWQEIDIDDEWSIDCASEKLDRMLRLLITRSSGSLRKLRVSCVNNDDTFAFIAENAGSLQRLVLQRSEISDSIVEKLAGKFSRITSLDLSYCCRISTRGLEAIGKNCKLLSSLSWNMHPLGSAFKTSHSDEAHAIARTMPKLKQLELAYLRINLESVLDILSGCPNLEFLDLRGCWDVHLDKKLLEKRHPKLEILGPQVVMGMFEKTAFYDDYYDSDFSDFGYMDYSDDESFDGMWDEDDIELRIYESADNMYEFGWPPSP
ncbi:F-box protein FBW2 [Amaranthus tricolor]|uniref:F-box protein FBW2 n=1 Tax=Amaranthus tricolor TaxID=29722 RepID=UPI00259078AD|nr:F-box protein FBW2 [Amaranthus tricolor]XP_057533457.1 F-box protein FBW2 [Amaranthus tricolor]